MDFCHLLTSGWLKGNAKKIILNFRCFGVAFALQTLINHLCHISLQICHETGDSDVWLSIICGAHGNYKYYNNFWKLTKLMHCIYHFNETVLLSVLRKVSLYLSTYFFCDEGFSLAS